MEKTCPFCGTEIQGGSIICPNCGKNLSTLDKDDSGGKVQGISMRTIPQIIKIKKPLLGGIGIVLMVLGAGIAICGNSTGKFTIGVILFLAVGLILLVSALVTKNIKFWG